MRTVRLKILLVPLATMVATLAACTLSPRDVRPELPVPTAFETLPEPHGVEAVGAAVPAAAIGWRDFFGDAQLQDLIGRALANNRDLRIAALNVEAARALYRIERANLVPHVDAVASGVSQRVPGSLSASGASGVSRVYSVGLGAPVFELDLFGRVRSLRRAALEQYLSLEETRTAAQLVLIADVADAWLTLLADRQLLTLAQATLASQTNSADLTRMRFEAGVASEVDVHQSETALHEAAVNIASFTRRVAQDRNALALLVGEPLPTALGEGTHELDAQFLARDLPAGLPAELLERRPDIRAAEHGLRAANADIGAARAAFFPSITLTGFAGVANTQLAGLFDAGHSSWSFEPQVRVPIFAAGANAANLDVAQLRKRIEIARYEQSIQGAFREVADALAARATLVDQLQSQQALTRAAESSYRLADMRYRGGVDSYLTSLIAQRDLFTAQQALIETRLAAASAAAALYKALGGGWTAASVP